MHQSGVRSAQHQKYRVGGRVLQVASQCIYPKLPHSAFDLNCLAVHLTYIASQYIYPNLPHSVIAINCHSVFTLIFLSVFVLK